MIFNLITASALMAVAVSAAPTETFPGPPVIYVDEIGEAAETAVALAPPAPTPTVIPVGVPEALGAALPDSVSKRGAANTCVAQPAGIEHKTQEETAAAFVADPYYADAAKAAKTPLGFNKIFENKAASINARGYAGFTLLQEYDVQKCADRCNAISGCSAFNIYFERGPSVNPNDESCKDPKSVTYIKCVWYKEKFTADQATNKGQFRNKFQTANAGGNGYVGTKYQRGFKIKTDGSGTDKDNRWLQLSPGDGSAIAFNEDRNFGGVFNLGEDGKLIQVLPWPGSAAALPKKDGSNQIIGMFDLGNPNVDYIKCNIDNIISCEGAAGWQSASTCRDVPQEQSGLMFFANLDKVPEPQCSRIGLYVDPI